MPKTYQVDRSRVALGGLHGWALAWALFWAVGVVLWLLASSIYSPSSQTQVIVLALALTGLGLIGAKFTSDNLRLMIALAQLRLGPWMSVGFAFGYGVATLAWLGEPQIYHGEVQRASLVPGGAIAGLGFIALVAAYRSTPDLLLRAANRFDLFLRGPGRLSNGPAGVWTLWLVAMMAEAINFAQGSLGYLADPGAALSTTSSSGAILSAVSQLGVLATLMAAWRSALSRRASSALLLLWVMGSQVVLGLFSGSKEAAIIQLVAFVVGYSAWKKLRMRTLVVSALIVILIVTPFVTDYRVQLTTASDRLTPIEAIQRIDFTQLIHDSITQNSDDGTQSQSQILDRWSRVGDVAIIVQKTPSTVAFASPIELIAGPFLGLVPRSLWSGKPVQDAGYQVNQLYYGAPATIYSSAATTPYGDLYRHGGSFFLVFGMVLLGMFVRCVDDRSRSNGSVDIRLMFLPMLLFASLVKQEQDFVGLSSALVSILISAAFAVRIVSRQARVDSYRRIIRDAP